MKWRKIGFNTLLPRKRPCRGQLKENWFITAISVALPTIHHPVTLYGKQEEFYEVNQWNVSL